MRMTTPPQGEHEQDPDRRPAGSWPSDDPNATRPAPAWPPTGAPFSGPPGQPPAPGYGPPATGQPFYGPPGGAGQQYGPPAQAYGPPFGQQVPYGYQPYGTPAYGPPAGPPARKSRAGLIAVVVGALLVLAAAAVALVLAMQTTVLDRTAVERDVAEQFEEREGVAVDLSCADEMTVTEGATYECTGTTEEDEEVALEISITDEEDAAYTWAVR